MDILNTLQTLQCAASQWADYLEESKKYGYGNLETDHEIADIHAALKDADRVINNLRANDIHWNEDGHF